MSEPTIKMAKHILLTGIAILLLGLSTHGNAAKSINVGSYNCPPFIIEEEVEGKKEYRGLSLLLWEKIAAALKLDFKIKNYELDDLLDQVAAGKMAVGVSCISITPERELKLDFSHSFYETHLAIAVKPMGIWGMIINLITNKELWKIIGIVVLVAGFVGGIFFLLERKINDKLYSMESKPKRGVEAFILGLLFVTKGPFNYYEFKTLTGRVLTVFLAILTTLTLASIIAVLTSTLTLGALTSDINGPNDLRGKKVGAKTESTASTYLKDKGIHHTTYDDLDGLLNALDSGEVQAIVADDAVLKYTIGQAQTQGLLDGVSVLPYQFERQNYGLVLTENSPYREKINQALLEARTSEEWQRALTEYLLR